ncbi:hypothetical protein HanRHA438_Chr10g0463831 [Helianthus annuus]|nr:hypothetical protein HanRHA438_Chr10g0463831 [Helianthus annuus]KAJ0884577.1 hypothetical protein HanPSC8_Chr10g0435361 [Helianthus annuus]
MMIPSTAAASYSSSGGMSTSTFGHTLPSSAPTFGALGFSSFNTLGPSFSNLVNVLCLRVS